MITKTALKRINWAAYKINQGTDKIGVFVSIVSTKIPYKGAGKEYIGQPLFLAQFLGYLPNFSIGTSALQCLSDMGDDPDLVVRDVSHLQSRVAQSLQYRDVCLLAADDMDELVHAVKHAIQQCGLQVNSTC